MSATFHDVRQFQARIDGIVTKERAKATHLFRRVCSVVSENVRVGGQYGPGTPVDTGFARNSWVEGINAEGEYVQPSAPPKKGAVALAAPSVAPGVVAEQLQLGDRYYLTSNCIYQRALDYGHSQQAPNGHVRLVADQLPQIVSDVAHEELPLFAGAAS